MATEIATSFWQITDNNGDPVSGAKIYVYDAGTTTPRSLYSNTGLSVSVSNPIICNSAGRSTTDGGTTVGMVYTAAGSYKIVVKNSADVTIYTLDNIDGRVPVGSGALAIANGGTGATTAPAALTNLGAVTSTEFTDLSAQVATLAGAASSSEKTHIATGTTGQRPSSPVEGDIRRNTTVPQWEGYVASWEKFATSSVTITPTSQDLTSGSSATYTTPAGCKLLRIRMIGGGGGGGGCGTTGSPGTGGTGGTTSFNSITAIGGSGGVGAGTSTSGGAGGIGGTGGSGSVTLRITGAKGGQGGFSSATTGPLATLASPSGYGAASPFAGGAPMPNPNTTTAGNSPVANSGCGGSGAFLTANGSGQPGGGGAGEYVEFWISNPSATYTYSVGAAGTAGTTGTGTNAAGGAGAAGRIVVEEHYIG